MVIRVGPAVAISSIDVSVGDVKDGSREAKDIDRLSEKGEISSVVKMIEGVTGIVTILTAVVDRSKGETSLSLVLSANGAVSAVAVS